MRDEESLALITFWGMPVPAIFSGFSPVRLCGLLCCVWLALLSAGFAHAGRPLEIYGSAMVEKEIMAPLSQAFEKETGAPLILHGVGDGQGLVALLQGKADVAMVSESLEDAILSAENAANQQGIALTVPANLKFHGLGKDRLLVVVNRLNPIVELSRTQLKDIHTGKITNWQAVGGENLAVRVITGRPGNEVRTLFQKSVMGGEKYTTGAREVDSGVVELHVVSQDKGGIGVVSSALFAQNARLVKFIKAPLLTSPFGLITIGSPTPEIRELIDYVRAELK
ncbi:MAG: substrate-binding domain-containing protein [Sulfuricellaceae bacterium]